MHRACTVREDSYPTALCPVLHIAQRPIQIGPKVLDGLDTHAQP
jgi:hypothetical protein